MGDILFLAHRVPWPPNRGDKIRSHHLLQKLMDCAPVHLACFADDEHERHAGWDRKAELASSMIVVRHKPKWRAGLEALTSGEPVSVASFSSPAMARSVERLIATRPIRCIVIFSGQMAQFVPPDFDGRVVMDFADVDSAKFESYGETGSGPMGWIHRREGRLLKTFEAQIAARADYSLFVSEAEARMFRSRVGLTPEKVLAVGNGVDPHFYLAPDVCPVDRKAAGPLILFTGQMDYAPNVQAVRSFASEAMPRILARCPEASFAIVGRSPSREVQQLDGRNGTVVTGAVDDIRGWIRAADVVVAPLRIARGIQNKVLEAMAMARPVVASQCAAEGIDAVHDRHLLIAASVEEEAAMVADLLHNPERAERLGAEAAQLIRTHYSWSRQLAGLPALCGLPEPVAAKATA